LTSLGFEMIGFARIILIPGTIKGKLTALPSFPGRKYQKVYLEKQPLEFEPNI
jgi:hypothetical protein